MKEMKEINHISEIYGPVHHIFCWGYELPWHKQIENELIDWFVHNFIIKSFGAEYKFFW